MKLALFTSILFLSFQSQALGAWSGKFPIKSVKATSGGVEVVLSAYMAKEHINISYYGCMSNGQIKVGSVLFQ